MHSLLAAPTTRFSVRSPKPAQWERLRMQWKTTVTDPNNHPKDLYSDAYQNLVKVDEHNQGSTYTTLYTYDAKGNPVNITDALGNVRYMQWQFTPSKTMLVTIL